KRPRVSARNSRPASVNRNRVDRVDNAAASEHDAPQGRHNLFDSNPCCLDDSLPYFRIRFQKLPRVRLARSSRLCTHYVRASRREIFLRELWQDRDLSFARFHWTSWLAQRRLATRQHNLGHPTRRWSAHPVPLEIA